MSGSQAPQSTRRLPSSPHTALTSAVLPMPASPSTTTARPAARDSSIAASRIALSRSRSSSSIGVAQPKIGRSSRFPRGAPGVTFAPSSTKEDRLATRTAPQDAELKARHRAMWASGDYPSMVETWLTPLGPSLVKASGIGPGARVLDVAAGTGNAAIPAALAGASVVASDLTPELLDAGRARAEAAGASLDWVEADAE